MIDENLKRYFETTPENGIALKEPYYAEVRIPEEMFDTNISHIFGDMVSTFAFFDIHVWPTFNDERFLKDSVKIKLRLPSILTLQPTRIDHDTTNKLYVLEFFSNDLIIVSTKVPKKSSTVLNYFDLLIRGKLPEDIGYDELSIYLEESCRINNFDPKVNSLFIDIIVASIARDPNNITRQFREAIKDNPRISMYDRKLVNMDIIPSLISQFSAISSGNPKYGMTSTIGAVRSGDLKPETSEMEKAIE